MGALVSCSERQSQGPRASLAAEQTTGLSSWAAATPAWPTVPHRWAPQIVRMAGDRRAPRVGEDGSPSSYGELSRCPSLTGCGGRSRRGRGAQQLKGTRSGQQDALHAALTTHTLRAVRTVQGLCPLCLLTLNSDQPIISSAPPAVEYFIPVSSGNAPVVPARGESLNIC